MTCNDLETPDDGAGAQAHHPFLLDEHPFYWFTYIVMLRGRALNRTLAEYNVDYSKWRVLAVLKERPGCTMQVLSDTAGVDRTTLTHTVRLMTEAGLVHRTKRETDRRSVVLSLTPAGEEVLDRVLPLIMANNDRCLAGINESEINDFLGILRRIIANIREPENAADEKTDEKSDAKTDGGSDFGPDPTNNA